MEDNSKPETPPLPNDWLPTALGAMASCVVLICGAVLAAQYLASRPLDLREATLVAADTVEAGLISNRVPEQNIRASAELRSTDTAQFHYFEFDVTVPSIIDPERLQSVLRGQLQQLGVSAAAMSGGRGEPMLELVLADHLFGYVRLSPQPDNVWHEWPTLDEVIEPDPVQDLSVEDTVIVDVPATPVEVNEAIEDVIETAPVSPVEDNEIMDLSDLTEPADEDEPVEDGQPEWTPSVQTASLPEATSGPGEMPGLMRVAIILDDGGYGGDITERILALDRGLTLSILPYTPHGMDTARRAAEFGFEVMLHMPMENLDPELRHEGQLDTGMSPAAIGALTLQALDEVPGAVGVNNHMGSKFTADSISMSFFVDVIKDRSLYFVDSRTTADSRAYQVAFDAGLPVGYRHIFLDHENESEAIERQFELMMTMVEENGSIIAIAHFRPNTIEVLERLLPTLESAGIDLVHASELLP